MSSTNQFDRLRETSFVNLAIAFELSLAVVGGLLAWATGVPIAGVLRPAGGWPTAIAWGLMATVPLVPLLVVMLRCRWRPIAWLRRFVGRFIRQMLGGATWWQLLAVSLAAGIGEEVLFRGALQPLLVRYTTPLAGVVIASLLFGVVHAASWSYFALAAAVGAYFGGLVVWRGEIVSAIVAHAAYDFLALTVIARGWWTPKRPLFSVRESGSSTSAR